jgi:hypothetical protein
MRIANERPHVDADLFRARPNIGRTEFVTLDG